MGKSPRAGGMVLGVSYLHGGRMTIIEEPIQTPPATPPRHLPVEIAPDTWVIQATVGEGVNPVAVHMNAMVINGPEPIVVDTGCPGNRERYFEDLFGIVDPDDVRWVFISHDDIDHYGNLTAVMDACPNATLVATWFLCQRLQADGFAISPERWRWVGPDEAFDVGDRTLLAVRPPLYDSPTTRGLFDPTTGVYWASDCYATTVERGAAYVEELDPDAWAEGFAASQYWNSPWLSLLDEGTFAKECARIERLDPRVIATAHGPTIEASDIPRAFDLLRALPSRPAPPQPGQPVLDGIIAAMSGTR